MRPAIFYIPHADDEAIGMAGAICEYKAKGRPVFLVLLTDGYNEKVLQILNGQVFCTTHGVYHNLHLTMQQLIWARKIEFFSSAMALAVDRVFVVNNGEGFPDRQADNPSTHGQLVSGIRNTIKYFESQNPGASHISTSGPIDTFSDTHSGARDKTQPTHMACWEAAASLRNHITDIRFQRVYIYLKPRHERFSDRVLQLEPAWQSAKQRALKQYRLFLPKAGRYAIGYHSAGSLIDAAYADDREYIELAR